MSDENKDKTLPLEDNELDAALRLTRMGANIDITQDNLITLFHAAAKAVRKEMI